MKSTKNKSSTINKRDKLNAFRRELDRSEHASGPVPGTTTETSTERWPFTIRIVGTDEALREAVEIRMAAYARHVPELRDRLDNLDIEAIEDRGTYVLLAESKLDGSPLGTMRVQIKSDQPVPLELSVGLPKWLKAHTLAEIRRLDVGAHGRRIKRLITNALFKAHLLFCRANGVDWSLVAAKPSLVENYKVLGFADVFSDKRLVPMHHEGNLAHRILGLEMATIELRLKAVNSPLYSFFFETIHPDIGIGSVVESTKRPSGEMPPSRRIALKSKRSMKDHAGGATANVVSLEMDHVVPEESRELLDVDPQQLDAANAWLSAVNKQINMELNEFTLASDEYRQRFDKLFAPLRI